MDPFKGIDLSALANPKLTMPKLPPNPLIVNMEANYASEFYRRIGEWLEEFQDDLDDDHEVGVRLVSFGQAVTFHLTSMGYYNPSIISFVGITDSGNQVQLIQHVTQISILLMKMPKLDKNAPARRIGFHTDDTETGSGTG